MQNFNKNTGPKPSRSVFGQASLFAREGTGDFMAIAMAMRPQGTTQKEVITLLGRPHRNVIKKLIIEKRVKPVVLPDSSRARRIRLVKRS